ncbi:MAG: lipase maturation factor family protein [Chlamydiales bacterium]
MWHPEDYQIAATLFIRLLGLIYFFAFFPFIYQIKGLIGSEGILPVQRFLDGIYFRYRREAYYYLPSLFWFNSSDHMLLFVPILGSVLSLFLLCGIYPFVLIPILMVLYLSIISVGQDFLSFGWEMFLMEISFNAFFLSWTDVPNLYVWISINLLLARFHFQAGAVKIQSQDPSWRNLQAVGHHYQSQPIPNTIAWYVYKLPIWFHKVSTLMMFIIELVFPLFVFDGEVLRFTAFLGFFGLQFIIWLTGNFSYLNHMTAVLSIILLPNSYLNPFFAFSNGQGEPSLFISSILSIIGVTLVALQLMRLWTHFFPSNLFKDILRLLSPFHLINRYGIFAVMTIKRYEIIIEGSEDGQNWKEYLFRYKPSDCQRRPRRISPFQPRLDWQAWFLPFSGYHYEIWFQNFLHRILEGSPSVLSLVRFNPFPEVPPRYIRAKIYDYTYTTSEDKKKTGNWWNREFIGYYSPVLTKK